MFSSKDCLFCKNIITGDYRKKFCNHSCAASFNNSKFPKRKAITEFNCKKCGGIFPLFRTKYGFYRRNTCDDCIKIIRQTSSRYSEEELFVNQTKESLYGRRKNWQSANSSIRNHSRKVYLASNKLKCCIVCQYNKHIEIAHIKQVKDFPNTATVLSINFIDNLVAFCPTHHWELDNGFLDDKVIIS